MTQELGPYGKFAPPSSPEDADVFWRSILREVNAHKNWKFFLDFIDCNFSAETGTLISAVNIFSPLSMGLPTHGCSDQIDNQDRVSCKIWHLIIQLSESLGPNVKPMELNALFGAIRFGKYCRKDVKKIVLLIFNFLETLEGRDNIDKCYLNELEIVFFNNEDLIEEIYRGLDSFQSEKFYNLLLFVSNKSEN
jgi:hypothetical protein